MHAPSSVRCRLCVRQRHRRKCLCSSKLHEGQLVTLSSFRSVTKRRVSTGDGKLLVHSCLIPWTCQLSPDVFVCSDVYLRQWWQLPFSIVIQALLSLFKDDTHYCYWIASLVTLHVLVSRAYQYYANSFHYCIAFLLMSDFLWWWCFHAERWVTFMLWRCWSVVVRVSEITD